MTIIRRDWGRVTVGFAFGLCAALTTAAFPLVNGLPVTGKQSSPYRETLGDLRRYLRDGLAVELRPDDAADLLNRALADKKRDVFEFFIVSQDQKSLVIGINCSMLNVCGQMDKEGWVYRGNFWIAATCEAGCDSHRFPPQQAWCNVTLERKHNRTFELYVAIPEQIGGKPKLSSWKVTSMFAATPAKPK